jgi:hypothetical protein
MSYFPAQGDYIYGDEHVALPDPQAPEGYRRPDDSNFNYRGSPYKAPENREDQYKIGANEDIVYDPESELASFLYMMVNG